MRKLVKHKKFDDEYPYFKPKVLPMVDKTSILALMERFVDYLMKKHKIKIASLINVMHKCITFQLYHKIHRLLQCQMILWCFA